MASFTQLDLDHLGKIGYFLELSIEWFLTWINCLHFISSFSPLLYCILCSSQTCTHKYNFNWRRRASYLSFTTLSTGIMTKMNYQVQVLLTWDSRKTTQEFFENEGSTPWDTYSYLLGINLRCYWFPRNDCKLILLE